MCELVLLAEMGPIEFAVDDNQVAVISQGTVIIKGRTESKNVLIEFKKFDSSI